MNIEAVITSVYEKAILDFSRSGSKGGQNVNKLNTKTLARIQLDDVMGLSPAEKERAAIGLKSRTAQDGFVFVFSQKERSRELNIKDALEKLAALILDAARIPQKRIPTKPSKAKKENRLNQKKIASRRKQERARALE